MLSSVYLFDVVIVCVCDGVICLSLFFVSFVCINCYIVGLVYDLFVGDFLGFKNGFGI